MTGSGCIPAQERLHTHRAGDAPVVGLYDTKPADSTVSVESIAKIIRRAMQDHSVPATVRSEKAAHEIAGRFGATLCRAVDTDPMERLTASALIAAGIEFITDHEPESPASLDFFLPDSDLHIEVKRFHSERVADQLRRAENVILLQGRASVRFFSSLVAETAGWQPMDSAPRDQVIIAMARYRDATAGAPAFVHFMDGEWRQLGRARMEPMVCWAWKPRDLLGDWPSENRNLGGYERQRVNP